MAMAAPARLMPTAVTSAANTSLRIPCDQYPDQFCQPGRVAVGLGQIVALSGLRALST